MDTNNKTTQATNQEPGMVAKPLSTELVSLINYVELNKNGWWKKATSQIILGYLWESDSEYNERSLKEKIKKDLNIEIPTENITDQIEYLLSRRSIIKKGKNYILTEETRKELNAKSAASFKEDEFVEKLFKDALNSHLPDVDVDIYWQGFKSELISSVRKIGANTYTFLKSGRLFKTHDWLSGFLGKHPDAEHQTLLRVISDFFNPNNEATKSYILRLLNAYFFVEASQLNKETIKSLEATRKSKDLKIVLDTNFVFSILGLHENPADESATSLLSLAEKIGNFRIRYYILPTTLEEIRKVVSYQLESLKRHRYSPHLAKAAILSGMRSSIAAKYFSESAKSEHGLSPDAYFLPFTDGLLRNLESKGIKILEWQTIQYPTDERVIQEQVTLWEKEEKKPEHKQKRYEAIEHDLIFWFSIYDHRDGTADSALEETYWGVTIDWSMIQFDQTKRRLTQSKLPVVLHPTNLVQLLQFWVPRDDTLESGILETIKLPLFFGEFDTKDEKATIELIQALSTYKGIDDIDVEILSSMLADKALKQKIIDTDSQNEEIIEIIESEFAHIATNYKNEFESIDKEKQKLHAEISVLNSKLESFEKNEVRNSLPKLAHSDVEQLPPKNKPTPIKDKQDTKAIASLKEQIKELEIKISNERAAKIEFREKTMFSSFFIVIPLLILFVYFNYFHSEIILSMKIKGAFNLILSALLCYFVALISSMASNLYIERHEHLKKWWLVRGVTSVGGKILSPFIIALVSMKDELISIIDANL